MRTKKKLIEAAQHMDWSQVVANGGPPCFRIEDGRFCGRAERWDGHAKVFHGSEFGHKFVPLHEALK